VRERLTTLACALGALAIFMALFVRGGSGADQQAALPTTEEHRGNGLLGARTWLTHEGVRTVSLRERFDTLARRHDLATSGNLLIVSLPVATPLRVAEVRSLDDWIRAGNTLLVLAALSDRPDWAVSGWNARSDVQLLAGLDFQISRARPKPKDGVAQVVAASRELKEPQRATLLPNRPHPYLHAVHEAVALSDYPPITWTVRVPRDGFMLALAHQSSDNEAVLWVRPDGEGTLIVSAFGSLFGNRALGLGDNAQLLANLVASTVTAQGAVLFDDEHQGLSSDYDPVKFYADGRLYRTLGVLAVVWLAWVLGGTRLRVPVVRVPAPREADLVRATGTFLARVLQPAAAARRMFEHFFQRLALRTRAATPEQGLPWDWLENHPRLSRADVRQLRDWYTRAYSGQRVPLAALHDLIVSTERRLTA